MFFLPLERGLAHSQDCLDGPRRRPQYQWLVPVWPFTAGEELGQHRKNRASKHFLFCQRCLEAAPGEEYLAPEYMAAVAPSQLTTLGRKVHVLPPCDASSLVLLVLL